MALVRNLAILAIFCGLTVFPVWARQGLSEKEIREGAIYSALEEIKREYLGILRRGGSKTKIARGIGEIIDLQKSFLELKDEKLFLQKHAEPKTQEEQEILASVRAQIPSLDESLVHFVSADSMLGASLGKGITAGVAFPIAGKETNANAVVMFRRPIKDADKIQDHLWITMDKVMTAFHEVFHQSHALRRSTDGEKRIRPGPYRGALQDMFEEGYTHLQTGEALKKLLVEADREDPVVTRLDQYWKTVALANGGEPKELSDFWQQYGESSFVEWHRYGPYRQFVLKVMEDAARGEALRVYVEKGDIGPLMRLMGRRRLQILAILAYCHQTENNSLEERGFNLRNFLYREMERVAEQPSYSWERLKSALWVRYFLREFLQAAQRQSSIKHFWSQWRFKAYQRETERLWDQWVEIWPRDPRRVFEGISRLVKSTENVVSFTVEIPSK